MNPLNPWVALTEILLLLGAAFGVGGQIAWLQYRKRIQVKKQAIQTVRSELSNAG